MAGLMDLIQARRARKMADGSSPFSSVLAAHNALAQQNASQAAAVQSGAFSTAQPPAPRLDTSAPVGAGGPQVASPNDPDVENATTSAPVRNFEAGVHDVSGGLDNAMAATAAALGGDVLAGRLHAAAGEHAARAASLTSDQTNKWGDVHGIGDLVDYAGAGLMRGFPMLATMAGTGALGKAFGVPAIGGVAAGSAALNTGSAYGEMADQPGVDPQEAGKHALMAGGLNALADTAAFSYASKLGPLYESKLTGLVRKSLAGHMMTSAAVEGGSGALREYVNRVATNHLLNHPDMFHLSPEDQEAIKDAAAQNIAATLPLAPAGHFGRPLANAADAGIDLAGKAIKGVRDRLPGGEPQTDENGQPVETPSIGTQLGQGIASVIDDPTKITDFAKQALDKMADLPLVGKAIQEGGDFFNALGQSKRVGDISMALDKMGDVVQKGYEQFLAGYKDQIGENASLTGAPQRYKTIIANALGIDGIRPEHLAQMGGEGLAHFINGINDRLPAFESKTGAIFNTVKGVADHAIDQVGDAVKSFKQGFGDEVAERGMTHSDEDLDAAAQTIATPPEGAPKQSIAGNRSPDQQELFRSLRRVAPEMKPQHADLLTRTFEPLADDPKAFNDAMARPGVAEAVAKLTGMHPSQFMDFVREELEAHTTHTEVAPKAGVEDTIRPVDEAGEELHPVPHIDSSSGDALAEAQERIAPEIDDQPGQRNPGMSPELFAGMLKNKTGAGSDLKVILRRRTFDRDTGAQIGPPVDDHKTVNLLNIAKTWAPKREGSVTEKQAPLTEQGKYDANLKEGIGAMFGGWHEKDEHGNTVEVKVQPAKNDNQVVEGKRVEGAKPISSIREWLAPKERTNPATGEKEMRSPTTGGMVKEGDKVRPRTFADVEEAGKANRPVDLASAISQYHDKVDAARERAEAGEWSQASAERHIAKTQRQAAENVARHVAERVESHLVEMTPEKARDAIEAAIAHVADPGSAKTRVPREVLGLPDEILEHGKAPLMAALADVEARVSKRFEGEQATSTDNPDRRDPATPDLEIYGRNDADRQPADREEAPGPIPENQTMTPNPNTISGKGGFGDTRDSDLHTDLEGNRTGDHGETKLALERAARERAKTGYKGPGKAQPTAETPVTQERKQMPPAGFEQPPRRGQTIEPAAKEETPPPAKNTIEDNRRTTPNQRRAAREAEEAARPKASPATRPANWSTRRIPRSKND